MDYNNQKYQAIVEKRSTMGKKGGAAKSEAKTAAARDNGRHGGAPQGNTNATKQPKQMLGLNEKTTQAVSVLESVLESDNSGSSTAAAGVGGVVSSKHPPQTTTVLNFIKDCKTLGYTLDESKAREILETRIDPAWLEGPFNFLEYTAQLIKTEYPDKPKKEKRRLFISALTWQDRRDEFPTWREQQTRSAAAAEEKRRKDQARSAVPEICGNCGATLAPDSRECPSCGWMSFFDENSGTWEFQKPIDFSVAFEKFRRHPMSAAEGRI
jgi:hypothetical protein